MTSDFIGRVVDNYRLLSELGVGGMGMVFKAIHIGLDKIVALKMIAPGMAMNANFIRRFQTEAKALARLQDPNIVQIFDLRNDGGQWFIVMEYVEGANLSEILADKKVLPSHEAVPVIRQVLSAIGHAHKAGIIHRDLKPNNIMLNKEGMVKITDFGLAKDQASIANTITVAGGGTLYYMSPEHVKGFSYTDHRSDIYSIGMTLYEMLSGNVPFKNIDSDFDIREMIIRKELVPPKSFNDDIPPVLERIVMKAISKNPEERYQSCEEMITDLDAYTSGAEPVMKDTAALPREEIMPEPGKRSFRVWWWAALLPLLLMAGYFLWRGGSEQKTVTKTARQVQALIHTNPAEALMILDQDTIDAGKRPEVTLQPGEHRIRLSREGFLPMDTSLTITAESNRFVLEMQPLPGKRDRISQETNGKVVFSPPAQQEPVLTIPEQSVLVVESTPEKAEVWLDEKQVGITPLTLNNLSAGTYRLGIRLKGFGEYQESITLDAGQNKRIEAALHILEGVLTINSQPSGATVFLDGERLGTTPLLKLLVPVGPHRLRVELEGYSSMEQSVEIRAEEESLREFSLRQAVGKLSVRVRPWGSIYIDNQLKKATTDFNFEINLTAGTHRLRVAHPTLGFWEKEIRISDRNELSLEINFNKTQAVSVTAFDTEGHPVQAKILLNNEQTGEVTPYQIKLRTGLHRLSVEKEGYVAMQGEKRILIDNQPVQTQKFILQKIE